MSGIRVEDDMSVITRQREGHKIDPSSINARWLSAATNFLFFSFTSAAALLISLLYSNQCGC